MLEYYAKPIKRKKIPPLTAKQIIEVLKADGWYDIKDNHGSHIMFKHKDKPGKIPVPKHGKKTLTPDTQKSIIEDSGIPEEVWLTWRY